MSDAPVRVAVILFPGSNCEIETARAVEAAGMRARIVRWNERLEPEETDAYVLPGGWSYEDRIRAGAIAAHDRVMRVVREEAEAGKPVLGICNGAQILAEAGLVPGPPPGVRVALAPNERGYRCAWVWLRLVTPPERTAFTSACEPGAVIRVPIAHGEGRFLTSERDPAWLERQTVFRYCREDGAPATSFPENPNGSVRAIAALSNDRGNVLAIMPHPERASWWRQHPRGHARTHEEHAPAHKLFQSLRRGVLERR